MNNNLRMFLGYLGFIPFGILTIFPWVFGEVYTKQSYFLLIIFAISFPLFNIFEKRANEFMSHETYLKLRRNLTSAVSGCFLLSLLTTF